MIIKLGAYEEGRGITQNPSAWQASEHTPDVPRFVMERFPFTIIYTKLAEKILIVAVAHSSREPGYWRRQL